jgi:hypothetical protein
MTRASVDSYSGVALSGSDEAGTGARCQDSYSARRTGLGSLAGQQGACACLEARPGLAVRSTYAQLATVLILTRWRAGARSRVPTPQRRIGHDCNLTHGHLMSNS